MALKFLEKILPVKIIESKEYSPYDITNIGNLIIPEKITEENSYLLCSSVAELFFPVDFYADRLSKLRYFIANKSGKEVSSSPYNRLISEINPFFSFNDLIYQYVFSLLSDGNGITYVQSPSVYQNVSANTISRIDVLLPNLVNISEYTNVSTLNYSRINDMIKSIKYNDSYNNSLIVENVIIDNYGAKRKSCSSVLASSPILAANKSIDTLLSVYSARYNVYANNGAAGYLARKSSNGQSNMQLEQLMTDTNKRDEIIADIKNRNGLTGQKNLFGVTGVPIEFVKTLATIAELVPLEETLESSIKIASIFQIPPVLVPRKDQSTYDNQENAEKIVWENGLLSMLDVVLNNWNNILKLNDTPYKLGADISNVTALVENKNDKEDLKTKKLNNLKIIKELNPDIDITEQVNKIYNGEE